MRIPHTLVTALAILLAGPVFAQNYNGTWALTPTVQYSCMSGLVQFTVQRLAISGTWPQVTIALQPSFSGGSLSGTFTAPNSLTATRVLSGGCTESYQIALTFLSPTQCAGTFSASYSGSSCLSPLGSCTNQNWPFTGVLQVPASYATFGPGCPGSLGIPHLQPLTPPRLGTTCQVRLDNLPLGIAFLATGFSATTSALGPLPLSLAPFGMAGCFGRTSLEATEFVAGTSTTATWSLAVPNATALLGIVLYQQALVPSAGTNPAGAVVSDAAAATLGF